MTHTPKEKPTCSSCGSDDVLADAYAAWDAKAQKWEVHNVFDKGAICQACDGETRLKWVKVKDSI